jgi:hypothetical protein
MVYNPTKMDDLGGMPGIGNTFQGVEATKLQTVTMIPEMNKSGTFNRRMVPPWLFRPWGYPDEVSEREFGDPD